MIEDSLYLLQPGAHARCLSRHRTRSVRVLTTRHDVGGDLRSVLRRHWQSKTNGRGLGVPVALVAAASAEARCRWCSAECVQAAFSTERKRAGVRAGEEFLLRHVQRGQVHRLPAQGGVRGQHDPVRVVQVPLPARQPDCGVPAGRAGLGRGAQGGQQRRGGVGPDDAAVDADAAVVGHADGCGAIRAAAAAGADLRTARGKAVSSAAQAVGTQGNCGVFGREGSGNARQLQFLRHGGSGTHGATGGVSADEWEMIEIIYPHAVSLVRRRCLMTTRRLLGALGELTTEMINPLIQLPTCRLSGAAAVSHDNAAVASSLWCPRDPKRRHAGRLDSSCVISLVPRTKRDSMQVD